MVGRDNISRPMSLMGAFEKACPSYMSFGMSYEQYWDGDVNAHRMYREAHKLQISEANMMAWLQGRYFYDALCAASPILRSFSKAKRPNEYHKHPFDLFEEERKRREEAERRKKYERMKEKVALFAAEFNKKRKEVDADGRDGRSVLQTGSDHD